VLFCKCGKNLSLPFSPGSHSFSQAAFYPISPPRHNRPGPEWRHKESSTQTVEPHTNALQNYSSPILGSYLFFVLICSSNLAQRRFCHPDSSSFCISPFILCRGWQTERSSDRLIVEPLRRFYPRMLPLLAFFLPPFAVQVKRKLQQTFSPCASLVLSLSGFFLPVSNSFL